MILPQKIMFQVIFFILSPIWPICLLLLILINKFKFRSDSPKNVQKISRYVSKAQAISIGTLATLQCFLSVYLMVPYLIKPDWWNITWVLNLIWFFKAELKPTKIQNCKDKLYLLLTLSCMGIAGE